MIFHIKNEKFSQKHIIHLKADLKNDFLTVKFIGIE